MLACAAQMNRNSIKAVTYQVTQSPNRLPGSAPGIIQLWKRTKCEVLSSLVSNLPALKVRKISTMDRARPDSSRWSVKFQEHAFLSQEAAASLPCSLDGSIALLTHIHGASACSDGSVHPQSCFASIEFGPPESSSKFSPQPKDAQNVLNPESYCS